MKAFIKAALAKTNYRVTRRARRNRFSALEDALVSLKARGYGPKIVIDGGANLVDLSMLAPGLYPDAHVQAIEPQPGCLLYLEKLKAQFLNRMEIYPFAPGSVEANGKELLFIRARRSFYWRPQLADRNAPLSDNHRSVLLSRVHSRKSSRLNIPRISQVGSSRV